MSLIAVFGPRGHDSLQIKITAHFRAASCNWRTGLFPVCSLWLLCTVCSCLFKFYCLYLIDRIWRETNSTESAKKSAGSFSRRSNVHFVSPLTAYIWAVYH